MIQRFPSCKFVPLVAMRFDFWEQSLLLYGNRNTTVICFSVGTGFPSSWAGL